MYPKSSSSPAKPAIDKEFYERLNQLAKARGPLKTSGKIPDAPKPTVMIGVIKQSPLQSPGSAPADLASSAPKLTLIPKISGISNSQCVAQDACPCSENQDSVSVVSITPLALKASGSGRTGKNGKSASPSPRSQKTKDESRRSSPRISPASSTKASPVSSPRGSAAARTSAISVVPVATATSSAESSPSTTPRGESGKDKLTGPRKLERKLTQKVEELAANLREVFKGEGRRSRPGSGERSSPKTPDSPRVRFGSVDFVDRQVALDDPTFNAIVDHAAKSAFAQTWVNEKVTTADMNVNELKHIDKLRPTFIRDFQHSQYFCRDEKGKWVKLTSTDEFIDYVGQGDDGHLAEVVSHYASQNMGIFLKNVLFQRQDAQGKSHSVLKLDRDTPIIPQANARARYYFSRDVNGKLAMDYRLSISAETNPEKPIFARTADTSYKLIEISKEAKLEINVRVTFDADGQPHITDPQVNASGWKQVEFTV